MKNEELMKQLKEAFKEEAEERLLAMTSQLSELDIATGQQSSQIIESIFREAHSLKGAARAIDLGTVEKLCRTIEGVFDDLKQGKHNFSAALKDVLLDCVKILGQILEMEGLEPNSQQNAEITRLVKGLETCFVEGGAPPVQKKPPQEKTVVEKKEEPDVEEASSISSPPKEDHVIQPFEKVVPPVEKEKNEDALPQFEEVTSLKLMVDQYLSSLRDILQAFSVLRQTIDPMEIVIRKTKDTSKLLEYFEYTQEKGLYVEHLVQNLFKVIESDKCSIDKMMSRQLSASGEKKEGRILVVDDSVTELLLLKSILEMTGYEVITASDGSEAYSVLEEGEFDILISDIDMPKMTGIELTEKIRLSEKFRLLPIILVSARDKKEDRERGIIVGANAYITKTGFDQKDLLNAIDELL